MLTHFYSVVRKVTIAALLIIGAIFPIHAENQSLANKDTVSQLIVQLKPSTDKKMNAASSYTLDEPQADEPLTRLKGVVNRVLKARSNARAKSRLLKGQAEVAPKMQPKRAIDHDTVVLSLGVQLPRAEAEQLMKDIAKDAAVEHVEPDLRVQHFRIPNDGRYQEQWGYSNGKGGANLPAAWDQTDKNDVVVAVIDTGHLPEHPDLKDNLVSSGYDFISNANISNGKKPGPDAADPGDWITQQENDDPNSPYYQCGASDSSWHGSHVAGTIGAVTNNSQGVSGISWQGKLLPVRVLGKCGGYLSDVITGMLWAAGLPVANVPDNPHPAKVLNLSLGAYSPQCSQAFSVAIDAIKNKGANIVVAAGNSNDSVNNSLPANCNGVIAVGATDVNGNRAWFSNYGPKVAISAPGVDILSTVDAGKQGPVKDDYSKYNGTSMAAPHVAGTIALMLAVNPKLTPEEILEKLQLSARAFPDGSTCTKELCGVGLLDAGKAVELAKQAPQN